MITPRRVRIQAMPRWHFVFGKDWMHGPNDYEIGFMWHRNLDAHRGQMIYRRRFVIRLTIRIRLDRYSY